MFSEKPAPYQFLSLGEVAELGGPAKLYRRRRRVEQHPPEGFTFSPRVLTRNAAAASTLRSTARSDAQWSGTTSHGQIVADSMGATIDI